jgi:N-acetylmuramic acid 6-phosphate etherase
VSATLAFVRLLHEGDRLAVAKVGDALEAVARAADAIAARLDAGGRWIYAGAGTSGRLAALDAAELPPTFGTDPRLVVALLAGGRDAMHRSVEGAEDDEAAAARAVAEEGVSERDVLVAVSASGTTPFARAALAAARARGALTVAVSCAPGAPLFAAAEHALLVDVGPEVVEGSTRMKAGTAQKLVLGMLSTAVMHARGLVHEGEMVAVVPSNRKLKARAVRIAAELLDLPSERALELLELAEWNLPVALVAGKRGVAIDEARRILERAGGNVSRALESGEGATSAPADPPASSPSTPPSRAR